MQVERIFFFFLSFSPSFSLLCKALRAPVGRPQGIPAKRQKAAASKDGNISTLIGWRYVQVN